MRLPKIYAYLRVNEDENEKGEELKKLKYYLDSNNIGVEQIVVEVISGSTKAENRPKFKEIVKKLQLGDIIITTEFNRLGRYLNDSVNTFKTLVNAGIKVCIIEYSFFDNWRLIQDDMIYGVVAKLLIQTMGEAAEQQQMRISDRTTLAMKKLNTQGKKVGRPSQPLPPDSFIENYKQYVGTGALSGFTLKQFCHYCGISKSCYYNWVRKIERAEVA